MGTGWKRRWPVCRLTDPIRPLRRRTCAWTRPIAVPRVPRSRRRMAMKSMSPTKPMRKKAQTQARPAEGPTLDCGGRPRLDEPVSPAFRPLGEEDLQLCVIDLLRLCYNLLAQV